MHSATLQFCSNNNRLQWPLRCEKLLKMAVLFKGFPLLQKIKPTRSHTNFTPPTAPLDVLNNNYRKVYIHRYAMIKIQMCLKQNIIDELISKLNS